MSFGLFGLSRTRVLVQRWSGLKRFVFLTGVATALWHRTELGLNDILRLNWLRRARRTTLSRIVFTNRIRTLVSCLIYIIRNNGLLLLSLCNVATIPRKARLLNRGWVGESPLVVAR